MITPGALIGRAITGTTKRLDYVLKELAPNGKLFNDLRPPTPGEFGIAAGKLMNAPVALG